MTQLNGLFSLRKPVDLVAKLDHDLRRWLTAVDPISKEAQYAAFDFFVTAEHLPDWGCHAGDGSRMSLREYRYGAVVSHVATGAKHFRADDPKHKTVKDTLSVLGAFQSNAFQNDAFQTSRLLVDLEEGSAVAALDVAREVLAHWQNKYPT